jgi:phosphatidylglycerophosphate synthase
VNESAYERWLTASSASGLAVLALALPYPSVAVLVFLGWGGLFSAWLIIVGAGLRTPADGLTLLRLLLMFLAVALVFAEAWIPFAVLLFTVSLLLDLVDGWLAGKYGGTTWGAVYDMESDQLWVMGIAVGIHSHHPSLAWVLIFPALKFLQVLSLRIAGLPAADPKPVDGDNRRGRAVFAIVATGLLVSLLPGLPGALRAGVLLACLLLLVGSFAADQLHLWKTARRKGTP